MMILPSMMESTKLFSCLFCSRTDCSMASLKCIILTVMDESHQALESVCQNGTCFHLPKLYVKLCALETGQCTEILDFLY